MRRLVVTGLADADALFRQVTAQVRERGWLSPQTVIVLIGDGSEWVWQRAALFAPRCEILDFWHAMEYAWAYARLPFGEGARRADQWTRRVAADLKAGQVQGVIGAVESAHTQVVHARLPQAGMRWSVRGAQHVLALRALLLNGQWAQTDRLRLARAA